MRLFFQCCITYTQLINILWTQFMYCESIIISLDLRHSIQISVSYILNVLR